MEKKKQLELLEIFGITRKNREKSGEIEKNFGKIRKK